MRGSVARLSLPMMITLGLMNHGCFTNRKKKQLPVDLLAHLVKHCTFIADVMSSATAQAIFTTV